MGRCRWLRSPVAVVARFADEGGSMLSWVLSPRLGMHLMKGAFLVLVVLRWCATLMLFQ